MNPRAAGNIPAKKTANTFMDVIGYMGALVISKNPFSSGTASGLNIVQKATMTHKFGGFIEATFAQNDLKGLQRDMGQRLFKMQQEFMQNNQASWNFLRWNMGSMNERNPCRCNN